MDRKAVFVAAAGTTAVALVVVTVLSRPKKQRSAVVPETMKRILLVKPDKDMEKAELAVETVRVPQPKPGQVLIKMIAATVNPSDYGEWTRPERFRSNDRDRYIGKEGAGIVVASGGGIMAGRLVGQAVGVIVDTKTRSGTYGEYVCSDIMRVFPLGNNDTVQPQDAAAWFVNPYTVVAILDKAESHKARAFIHTAAASKLGQMMVKLCRNRGKKVVNLVRRPQQAALLKSLGAQYVVCQADEDWKQQLSALIKELHIEIAFDAVAGEMSGTLLSLLPPGGICYVYGGLSQEHIKNVDPVDLIYHKKQVKGFLLTDWMMAGGVLQMLSRLRKTQKLVVSGLGKGGWAETQFKDCSMESMHNEFLKMWNSEGFTGSKLRIRMD